jgi:poly-gamma-glutamate capsule biosynthesis protein CapA/YwtB (metallophosphatase superfamily)
MQKSTAGIVRGVWSYNETDYYLEALDYYDEVLYIDPYAVTYFFERENNRIRIEHQGRLLNNLSMLYTFGQADVTILLAKSLLVCGCPISDPLDALTRDCMGKISDSLNIFEAATGTSCHILTSYDVAEKYLDDLDNRHFPVLNKPAYGNQGKGILALNTRLDAIAFCKSHFDKSKEFLLFEKLMNYLKEWRVYVVDGSVVEAYEKVKQGSKIVANLHQGAKPLEIDAVTKQQIFRHIQKHLPEKYKLGIYGVDLALTDTNQLHIIEINRTPGSRGLKLLELPSFPNQVHKILFTRSRKYPVSNDPENRKILSFLGDTNPGETYQLRNEEKERENVLKTDGYEYSFSNFKDFLLESDFTIVNLEACITAVRDSPHQEYKPYLDWTDVTKTPQVLKEFHINAVSLANNHAYDFGTEGLRESLDIVKSNDIQCIGAGLDGHQAGTALHHYMDLGTRKLHVIVAAGFEYRRNHDEWGYYASDRSAGVNAWSGENAASQIKALRNSFPNAFIIAFPHWGSNYAYKSDRQEHLAKIIIDSGADMIVGHGSHMMQEIDTYRGKWILYGIGNFVFNSPGRFSEYEVQPFGLIPRLNISEVENAIKINVQIYPIFVNNKITRYQSHFVTKSQFRKVISFFMPHKGNQTGLEKKLRAGKDKHGYFLTFDVSTNGEKKTHAPS